MKVLVLHAQLGVLQGGGETFTRNLFSAFAERGHQIAAAFVADSRGRWPFPMPAFIKPIPLPGWWSSNLGQPTLSFLGRYLPPESPYRRRWNRFQEAITWRVFRWHNQRFQRRVEREFHNRWNDFDVIYVQSNVRLAASIAEHHPTILMLPGPVGDECLPMLRSVHAVCAHDDGFVQLRAQLGDRANELPLGLDTRVFTPGITSVRSRLGWTDQHHVIGYVGRLHPIKGVDLLSNAFREISRNLPQLRLLMVGSGQEEKNIRSDLAAEISRRLVHIEPAMDQEQLPDWYRAIDLLVMPSRYETMSNSVLEGMACGVPFLASKVGGNAMLGNTGAGWLFESGSASSLVSFLTQIFENLSELKARGNEAFHYVQNHHSWAVTAKRLETIIVSDLGVQ
jgi:glycosyltransferase involved in cell wall biosynthesis